MTDFEKKNTLGFIWTDTDGFEWIPVPSSDAFRNSHTDSFLNTGTDFFRSLEESLDRWEDSLDDQWEDTTEVLFKDTLDVAWGDTSDVVWFEGPGDQWEDIPEDPQIRVETPQISPVSGEYLESQLITITIGTPDATIYYTEDGSIPTELSTEYTAPFSLLDNKTIKAVGIKIGYRDSLIAEAVYTVTGTVVTPVIVPVSGGWPASTQITITTETPTANIYYTEDGSTPSASSILYTGSFTLTAAKTIKAIGIKDNFTDSGIVTEVYTIDGANVGDTLSTDNGIWLWNPSSYTYQWTRDTINITDATEQTYLIVLADSGTTLECKVTAINSQGSTEQLTSNSVVVV